MPLRAAPKRSLKATKLIAWGELKAKPHVKAKANFAR